ncbi:major facilitator superfamily transporter [Trichoderma gamsii]|uniref:Major facilitator superfamily transporter n=1 Tax=Trichoderma gamsii TaxID=398673 RepID=A0A0W7W3X2_9HYPO|nr:major facilitator superfamily transporter [Trichoderma gamsii]PNP43600.1 hypothetical protein TGAMA5MH_04572 [Trichoderma gamsii]PON28923.1 major facilitator superfamily transporter [Trichoderma gamsii]
MSQPTSEDEKPPTATTETSVVKMETHEYPSNQKRVLIMGSLYLAIFLVTLDTNIISTAIPRITDEFHSLNDVGWYGSAYLLTQCSFQLVMGKVYKYYPTKPILLVGIVLFEVGSAVCGAAPSSAAFIVGRAIAGLGASGIFSGIMVVLFHTIPLQQRPIYQGLFGAVFALASVIGPVVGGTFTDKVTWRWCFYINLPIGAVSLIVTTLILHMPNQKLETPAATLLGKVQQLDPIGNLAFFPGIICLILALQWGGTTYPWSDGRVIALFVICGVFVSLFIGIQIWKGEAATVPPRIAKQRSIIGSLWFTFFSGAGMMVATYYLPIWFQAIKGVDAITSGLMLLPTILSVVVSSMGSGILISKLGYYTPFFYISAVMMPIGAGLLSTLEPGTGHSKWIGYQVLFGLGLGFGNQQPLNVVQTILDRPDIATGSALVMFLRFLGSSIFLPVAQNIFISGLSSRVGHNIPDVDPKQVASAGATDLKNLVPASYLPTLLIDYNDAIMVLFYMMAGITAACIFGCFLVEWRSLKARAKNEAGAKPAPTDPEAKEVAVAEA